MSQPRSEDSADSGDQEPQPGPSRELRPTSSLFSESLGGSLTDIDLSSIIIIEDPETFSYVVARKRSSSGHTDPTESSSNIDTDSQLGRSSLEIQEDTLPSTSSIETSRSVHRSSLTGDSHGKSPKKRRPISAIRSSLDRGRGNLRSPSIDQDPQASTTDLNLRSSLMSVEDSFSTDFDVQQLSELDLLSNPRSSIPSQSKPGRSGTLDCLSMGSSLDIDEPRPSSAVTDSGMERGRAYRGKHRIEMSRMYSIGYASAETPDSPKKYSEPFDSSVEPPPDPATAQIIPNQETVIEVNTNNETLGIVLLGGCDTFINGPAAVLLDVFEKGAIGKDKRLKPGDQIRHANGIAITEQMTAERIGMSIKQWHPKMKMTVYRPEPHQFDILDIELARKPSKNLGISFKPFESNEGVYIQEILAGSAADLDGRLQKGDILISCDGKDLSKAGWLDAAVVLKLIGLRTQLKFKRYKVVR